MDLERQDRLLRVAEPACLSGPRLNIQIWILAFIEVFSLIKTARFLLWFEEKQKAWCLQIHVELANRCNTSDLPGIGNAELGPLTLEVSSYKLERKTN